MMPRSTVAATLLLCLVAAPAGAADETRAPPPPPFRKVSELVKLPDFLPGMGTLYVDPKTLPAGPFLADGHSSRLVNTIYMVPLKHPDALEIHRPRHAGAEGRSRRSLLQRRPSGCRAAAPSHRAVARAKERGSAGGQVTC